MRTRFLKYMLVYYVYYKIQATSNTTSILYKVT